MHRFVRVLLLAALVPMAAPAAPPPLDGPGPYSVDTSLDVSLTLAGQTMKVDLFAPSGATDAPLIVGAHGLSGKKEELTGWGRQFASHGFAVGIPQFNGTDSAAASGNADFEIALLNWMQTQGASSGNFFSGRVDGSRRAIFGHSMGGLVTHLAAARSSSIQVALALDGVDQNSLAANAVPQMRAFPVELRASIQSVCNLAAPAEPAVIAAFPGPYLVLTVANTLHCDPQDPETDACILACAATLTSPFHADPNREAIKIYRRYATAAMRYFLLCDADARTNIDGAAQQADLSGGLITDFTAHNIPGPSGCAPMQPDAGSQEPSDAGGEIDAGEPFVDAGGLDEDAGIVSDAGTVGDAGIAGDDAGSLPEDGGAAAESDGGEVVDAPVGGCQCSNAGDIGGVALLCALVLRRKHGSRRSAPGPS